MADEQLIYRSKFTGDEIEARLSAIWPIGSVFITINSDPPSEQLHFGTWERIPGSFLYGVKPEDSDNVKPIGTDSDATYFYGKENVTLVNENLPRHSHKLTTGQAIVSTAVSENGPYVIGMTTSTTDKINNALVNAEIEGVAAETPQSFSIMPPYFPVFMWYRKE